MGAPTGKEKRRKRKRERSRLVNELKFRLSDRHPLVNVARRNNFNACGVTSFFHTTFRRPPFVKEEVGPLHLEVADVIDCKCTREKKYIYRSLSDFLSRVQLLVKKRVRQGNTNILQSNNGIRFVS